MRRLLLSRARLPVLRLAWAGAAEDGEILHARAKGAAHETRDALKKMQATPKMPDNANHTKNFKRSAISIAQSLGLGVARQILRL